MQVHVKEAYTYHLVQKAKDLVFKKMSYVMGSSPRSQVPNLPKCFATQYSRHTWAQEENAGLCECTRLYIKVHFCAGFNTPSSCLLITWQIELGILSHKKYLSQGHVMYCTVNSLLSLSVACSLETLAFLSCIWEFRASTNILFTCLPSAWQLSGYS